MNLSDKMLGEMTFVFAKKDVKAAIKLLQTNLIFPDNPLYADMIENNMRVIKDIFGDELI